MGGVNENETLEKMRFGALQRLSSIWSKRAKTKGLMFTDVEITYKQMHVLINTYIFNLFMPEAVAKNMKFRLDKQMCDSRQSI